MNQALCLKVAVRLRTQDGRRCSGIAALLEQVRQCRALRAAVASMGMACSKAWKIVRAAEKTFGCKLMNSTTGGKHDGAALTAQAERLLASYRDYAASVEQFSQRRFQEAFGFCWDTDTDKEAE